MSNKSDAIGSIALLAGGALGGYVGYRIVGMFIPIEWKSQPGLKGDIVRAIGAGVGFIGGLLASGLIAGKVGRSRKTLGV